MMWEYPRKKRLKRTSRKGNEGKEQRRVRNKEHHKSERARVVIRRGYISRGKKEQTQQMSQGEEENLDQLIK